MIGKAKAITANPDPDFQADLRECYRMLREGRGQTVQDGSDLDARIFTARVGARGVAVQYYPSPDGQTYHIFDIRFAPVL